MITQLISGGQTGAERAALDWAIGRGIPHGGWCPQGRLAEDGPIDARYMLEESPGADHARHKDRNVQDSDGTVIFTLAPARADRPLNTALLARKHRKPCLHLHPRMADPAGALARFVTDRHIQVLNVTGPRASREPAVGAFVKETLESALFPVPASGRAAGRKAEPAGTVRRSSAQALEAQQRRLGRRRTWEDSWSRSDFAAPWMGRSVSKEIVAAVKEGWFAPGSPALDIGCGEGEVAAWLAEQGHPAVGLDIAQAAIARARRRHPEIPGRLEFLALDMCSQAPPDRRYGVLIDRGCLHTIAPADRPDYVRNLSKVAAPDARLLLFVKVTSNVERFGDADEEQRVAAGVEKLMGERFVLIRKALTFLDPFEGRESGKAMPGRVFWLVHRP